MVKTIVQIPHWLRDTARATCVDRHAIPAQPRIHRLEITGNHLMREPILTRGGAGWQASFAVWETAEARFRESP